MEPTYSRFPPIVVPVESGRWYRAHFCLLFELAYDVGWLGSGDRIRIPAGFVFDGASLPRPIEWVFGRYGRHFLAALVHDYLYQTQGRRKSECDRIFFEYMLDLGVPYWPAWLMWAGVTVGGWWSWFRHWLHLNHPRTKGWWVIGKKARSYVNNQQLYRLRWRARQFFLSPSSV